MDALILAGGKGIRMKPLTDRLPKALVELHEQPLIEHVLDGLHEAGVKRVVIVVGHRGAQVKKALANEYKSMKLEFITQKKQDGTARAFGLGKRFFTEPFLAGHCDVIAPPELWKKLAAKKKCLAVMAVRPDPHPEKFGVVTVRKGLVAEIVEKPVVPKSRWVNAGCYLFSPKIFEYISKTEKNPVRGEFEITDTLRMLIQQKKLGVVTFDGPVYDIGTPEDLYDAEIRTDT